MTDQGISSSTVQNEPAENSSKKAEIPQKQRKVLDGPTHLYRHYARKTRELLYVGISTNAISRLRNHKERSKWFLEVGEVHIDIFPTRAKARAEEKRLIKKHKPRFNIQHGSFDRSRELLIRRLVKHYGSMDAYRAYWKANPNGEPPTPDAALSRARGES